MHSTKLHTPWVFKQRLSYFGLGLVKFRHKTNLVTLRKRLLIFAFYQGTNLGLLGGRSMLATPLHPWSRPNSAVFLISWTLQHKLHGNIANCWLLLWHVCFCTRTEVTFLQDFWGRQPPVITYSCWVGHWLICKVYAPFCLSHPKNDQWKLVETIFIRGLSSFSKFLAGRQVFSNLYSHNRKLQRRGHNFRGTIFTIPYSQYTHGICQGLLSALELSWGLSLSLHSVFPLQSTRRVKCYSVSESN